MSFFKLSCFNSCFCLDTERAALNAGTVGFDRNIFSGNPTLNDLKGYSVQLTEEEKCEFSF